MLCQFLLYRRVNQLYVYISPLFQICFPFRSPQNIEQSFFCNTLGSHQLSILCVCVCQVVSDSLATLWTIAHQALCPRNFPGKNTVACCHFLLQGIFPTQGSSLRLLPQQADSLPLGHLGSLVYLIHNINSVYMSIPISQFIPPCPYSHPALFLFWYQCLFSVSVSVYLFCK